LFEPASIKRYVSDNNDYSRSLQVNK
jgi:hypothetical protein